MNDLESKRFNYVFPSGGNNQSGGFGACLRGRCEAATTVLVRVSPADTCPLGGMPGRGHSLRSAGRNYIMPSMPPIPPIPPPMPPPADSSFGCSATMQSVVSIRPATEAAFCSA